MSIELILGGIGSGLGGLNFLYWAWWARRDIVRIQNQRLEINAVEEDRPEPPRYLPNPELDRVFINAEFELVRSHGVKECFVRFAWLELSKTLCDSLNQYFEMPTDGRIQLFVISRTDAEVTKPFRELKIGQPEFFYILLSCPRKQTVRDLEKGIREASSLEERQEKTQQITRVRDMVERLSTKYKLGWTATTNDKIIHWHRFPKRRWHRLILDRLWWRM